MADFWRQIMCFQIFFFLKPIEWGIKLKGFLNSLQKGMQLICLNVIWNKKFQKHQNIQR